MPGSDAAIKLTPRHVKPSARYENTPKQPQHTYPLKEYTKSTLSDNNFEKVLGPRYDEIQRGDETADGKVVSVAVHTPYSLVYE